MSFWMRVNALFGNFSGISHRRPPSDRGSNDDDEETFAQTFGAQQTHTALLTTTLAQPSRLTLHTEAGQF